jgi:uncharacterized protein YeaO (DUF488 family)
MIQVRRAYETSQSSSPETRFLVDRLWPRGLKRASLRADGWLKDVAPSDELRRWFGHDPNKWEEFQTRYSAELDKKPEAWLPLIQAARSGGVTLLYGAKDEEHNNAVVLKIYLERKLKQHA